MIGDEIANRDVNLVTDGRDRGNCACGDGTSDAFIVECPEIFACATAASYDHHIGTGPAIHLVEGEAQLFGSCIPLDRCRDDDEAHVRSTTTQNRHDVVQRSAVW